MKCGPAGESTHILWMFLAGNIICGFSSRATFDYQRLFLTGLGIDVLFWGFVSHHQTKYLLDIVMTYIYIYRIPNSRLM